MKGIASDERRYGNSQIREKNNENWNRRSREIDKQKMRNLTVGVHDMSEISGTELGKYDTRS